MHYRSCSHYIYENYLNPYTKITQTPYHKTKEKNVFLALIPFYIIHFSYIYMESMYIVWSLRKFKLVLLLFQGSFLGAIARFYPAHLENIALKIWGCDQISYPFDKNRAHYSRAQFLFLLFEWQLSICINWISHALIQVDMQHTAIFWIYMYIYMWIIHI